jgi:hypothetical protein
MQKNNNVVVGAAGMAGRHKHVGGGRQYNKRCGNQCSTDSKAINKSLKG